MFIGRGEIPGKEHKNKDKSKNKKLDRENDGRGQFQSSLCAAYFYF